ncbi:hypothetical protein [Actinokineospora pegani]|uniref:hypothetical protein n=1 Tax=Actinokineospora pegani TaxID=2654637 RepID=UPI0012EAB90A|nr:hypothetical protein [Actinokineospora pegani]
MISALLFLALFALVLWLLSRVDADLTRAPMAGPTHLDRDAARLVAELRAQRPHPVEQPAPASARRAATVRPASGSR